MRENERHLSVGSGLVEFGQESVCEQEWAEDEEAHHADKVAAAAQNVIVALEVVPERCVVEKNEQREESPVAVQEREPMQPARFDHKQVEIYHMMNEKKGS